MNERERLIRLLDDGCFEACKKKNDDIKLVHYLADYLLENGVILSPVKVGDTVYMIQENDIVKLYINYIEIGINNTITDIDFHYANAKWEDSDYDNYDESEDEWFNISEINETVFLTHREARKALAERNK